MNPTDPKHPWARLTSAARTIRDERDTAAPHGFTTRIVARAFSSERQFASLLERFALRAVGVAGLLALVSVVVNYQTLATTVTADENAFGPNDDAVALVLNITD